MHITADALGRIFPYAKKYGRIGTFFKPLCIGMSGFDIDTPLRIAAFLSQIGVESGELKYTKEIWGPTAQQLKYEPFSSLSTTLGNNKIGDGARYRGRGLIQLTGRRNYQVCGDALGLPFVDYPELLEKPLLASLSAAWYWSWRSINDAADRGDIRAVTKLVNGGLTALPERQVYYIRALKEFS